MTQLGHAAINFAVMHTVFSLHKCGNVRLARGREPMRRREFITLLGGAAAAWPFAVHAQQARVPVIGVLSSTSPGGDVLRIAAFRKGLHEVDYIEGQNV